MYYTDDSDRYYVISKSRDLYGYGGIYFRRVISRVVGCAFYVYDSDFRAELVIHEDIRIGIDTTRGWMYVNFMNVDF